MLSAYYVSQSSGLDSYNGLAASWDGANGPGFLICNYASSWNPNNNIIIENSVFNGKALWSNLGKEEIIATSGVNIVTWKSDRFYLSSGENLVRIVDWTDPPRNMSYVNVQLKDLSAATSSPKLVATASASTGTAANANDGNSATAWTPTSSTNQWIELDFGAPTTINEFRIKEAAGSSITRYAIEAWDAAQSKWISVFNGRTIGTDFVAPIVSRTTSKVRLWITSTSSGNPSIAEFQAYNDIAGWTFTSPRGVDPPMGNPIPTTATATTLTSSPNPSVYGNSVTFTARVTSGAGMPTGTVTFKDGAATIGSGTLSVSGVATFSTSTLSAGTHSITATYAGSRYCLTSTSTAVSQVVGAAMGSSITDPSVLGQSVAVSLQIGVVGPAAGTPAGSVEFHDGSKVLASGTLDPTGHALLNVAALGVGHANLTAVSPGDTGSVGSASPAFDQSVVANRATGFDVQRGATQRSNVRYLDLTFGDAAGLTDLLSQSRTRLTHDELDASGALAAKKHFCWLLGDVKGDGRVNVRDFVLLHDNFGYKGREGL